MTRHIKTSEDTEPQPGTVVHKVGEIGITIIDYDEAHFEEKAVQSAEECVVFRDRPTVTWINIEGTHRAEVLEKLGSDFGLHPLIVEDILDTEQRPKLDDLDDCIFTVLKMLSYNRDRGEVEVEQVSLVLGSNFVLSFQEGKAGDLFDPVRERLRSNKGRIRRLGADYLAYALIDTIVDGYFLVLEQIGEEMEFLEEELVTNPTPTTIQALHNLKREMIFLRKSVWPLREVIGSLERGESPLIQDSTGIYLRDLYDHTIQVIDTIETFRDILSGMLDIYLSSISNKMNEVMKVLTIIATIFIPLTLVAGIYGMNFRYMPELEWRWGYPLIWLVMLAIAGAMLYYFRKKKWL
jgi:magnesium transporter